LRLSLISLQKNYLKKRRFEKAIKNDLVAEGFPSRDNKIVGEIYGTQR
jgi:hypothetical protein